MNNIVSTVLIIFGAIFLIAILQTIPLWFLWNWLMPEIFSLPTISLWQAFGLSILSSILFKSSNTNSK